MPDAPEATLPKVLLSSQGPRKAAQCRFQGLSSGVRAPLDPPRAGKASRHLRLPIGQAPSRLEEGCQASGGGLPAQLACGPHRLLPPSSVSISKRPSFPEGSNTDRPDASAVRLLDFQRFLLHEQQVREPRGRGAGRRCADGSHLATRHLPPSTCLPLETASVPLSSGAPVS